MKRSRDDALLSAPLRPLPVTSRGEQSGQAQMSTASSAHRLTTSDALTYLKAVREMFQDKKDIYNEFLDIMKDFKAQRIDTTGVISRVKELFKGHRNLILGFNTFLPKGFEITLPPEEEPFLKKKPVEFDEAITFVNKIKARFDGDDRVYKSFLDILNMYRRDKKSIQEVYHEVSGLFQEHADLLVEFTHFLPDTSGSASFSHGQPGRHHMRFGNDCEPPTVTTSNYFDKYATQSDSTQWNRLEKEKANMDDRENHEWEHDNLDQRRKSTRRDDSTAGRFHLGMHDPTSSMCKKVEERLQNPENYKKFLDCVRSYKRKFVTASQFQMLVDNLLGTHSDLMEECEDLITYVEKTGCSRNIKQVPRSLRVQDRDVNDPDSEERNKGKERDGNDRGLTINNRDALGQKMPSYASKEKFMSKPIQELDLSNCERCTPSYRLLPENYPIPSASWRTEIGSKVLNDHWVSVTSGSEDYSFKHMRKNQYEESLFRCEDDRFELDMLLESVTATAKYVEELLDSMNTHPNQIDSSFCLEDHLTAIHKRCIERLYSDHGLDVMDVLKKNAPLALPVILTRLKQKQEEWAKCRADFNKVWAEIYSKNYHKSLDHRSFYFKQQDTKNLSAKVLLAEIKELSEKSQTENEMALSIAAGYRQPIKPHLEFEYPDADVQEDVRLLMQFSSDEVCSAEQCGKMIKVWIGFVEQVFGILPHPLSAVQGEADKVVNRIAETVANIAKEMSTGGNRNIPTAQIVEDNAGVNTDGSPNTISSVAVAKKVTASATGEMSICRGKAPHNGPEGGSSDFGMGSVPSNDVQSANTDTASFSISMIPENIKSQELNGSSVKDENEEGQLSPDRNLGKYYSFGKIISKATEKPGSTSRAGGKEMLEEAEVETDAVADNEVEESAQGSLDSENASDNGDVTASESADGEECSPEDHDENDNKAESEGEAEDTEGVLPSSDRSVENMKPLKISVPRVLLGKGNNSQIFYGNDSFYIFFRLHQMLYDRMKIAKVHSASSQNKWTTSSEIIPADSYIRFKDALRNLLNGFSDNSKFEDDCRGIIGAQSYVLFTLDKLIHKFVKQLQIVSTDDVDNRLLQLYAYEKSRSPEDFSDAVYYENARFILPEENLYRIEVLPCPTRLTIQLMRNDHDKLEATAVSMDPKFAAYLNEELLSVVPQRKETSGVFLKRNEKRFSSGDEDDDYSEAMDGVVSRNGLEIKVSSNTLKVAYVLATEDYFYRANSKRKELSRAGKSIGGPPERKRRRLTMFG